MRSKLVFERKILKEKGYYFFTMDSTETFNKNSANFLTADVFGAELSLVCLEIL